MQEVANLERRQSSSATSSHAPLTSDASSTTTSTHDLAAVEGLRALAALLVVLTHVGFNSGAGLNGPWAGWLARGDAGVAVFFVLSGFLLMRGFTGPRAIHVGVYLWRRFLRLAPAYAAALVGVWLLVPSSRAASSRTWAAAMTLSSSYVQEPLLPGFSHTWSLGTEVAFYLALPVLAWFCLGRARTASGRVRSQRLTAVLLVVLIGLGLTWRTLILTRSQLNASVVYWLPGFLDWFAVGMLLAWVREASPPAAAWLRESAQSVGSWWTLAAVFYWVSTTSLAGPYNLGLPTTAQMLTKHLLYLCFATALVVPVAFARPGSTWLRPMQSRPVIWVGTISYGLFLWHMVILTSYMESARIQPFSGHFVRLLAITLGGGLIAGALSWYLVEQPIQRRLRDRVG